MVGFIGSPSLVTTSGAEQSRSNRDETRSPAVAFYTNHAQGSVSAANSPARAHKSPRRGNRGKAAKYGPLDRAAESWTDRELTECLRRFIDPLISALGSGRAYLADAKGKPPEGWAAACGWTWYQHGVERGSWEIDNHNSARIGWLDDGRVYLDANEAARLTQAFAAQQNKPLSNPDTVVARLAEKGWLAVERTGGRRGTRRGRP